MRFITLEIKALLFSGVPVKRFNCGFDGSGRHDVDPDAALAIEAAAICSLRQRAAANIESSSRCPGSSIG